MHTHFSCMRICICMHIPAFWRKLAGKQKCFFIYLFLFNFKGYHRGGDKEGQELTEQEMLELELEERRRQIAKRRKLFGDGEFAVRLN